jgi:hypothetical protein
MALKRKGAGSNLVPDYLSVCTLLTCSCGLCGYRAVTSGRCRRRHRNDPGEESRGRSKSGEEYQKGYANESQLSSSPNVLTQSAQTGCKRTVKVLPSKLQICFQICFKFLQGGVAPKPLHIDNGLEVELNKFQAARLVRRSPRQLLHSST